MRPVVQEEDPLPEAPERRRAELVAARARLENVVGEARAHLVQREVGVENQTVEPLERGLRDALRQFERRHVRNVLSEVGFDKREAARRLRISLASLYRKLAVLATLYWMAPAA